MIQPPERNKQTPQKMRFLEGRLVSLDVFRGIAVAFMILLGNLGGDTNYSILQHADWNGLTLADVFFPFFLFIVGAAIPYSLGNKLDHGESKKRLLPRIVRRTVILFALGVFINGFPYFDLSTLRIMGVLQRIAVCYLVASTFYLVLDQRKRVVAPALLMVLYWVLMTVVPVPGYGPGVLDKNGNLAAYIDRLLFPGHLYAGMWDPEGFLSTIPALATTMLGVLSTEYLRASHGPRDKSANLFFLGIALIVIGAFWNLSFPINKNLWTSSFVALTGGMALLVFDLSHYIIDIRKHVWWTKPFIIFGLNAITAYVLTEIVNLTLIHSNITLSDGSSLSMKSLIYERLFASWAGPLNGSLFYGLASLTLWLGIMAVFYRRRIFVKV